MVGNQRKIGIAGGDEGDRDEVDPKSRIKAFDFESRRCEIEIMRPREQHAGRKDQRNRYERGG